MKTNPIKQRIRYGQVALTMMSGLSDPVIPEILGLAGFDGIVIETEHTAVDPSRVRDLIVASELAGIGSVIRVPRNDWNAVLRFLDAGVQGVQVAHISTREHAQEAVDVVRYAPMGRRGAAPTSRAAGFGDVEWEGHVKTSNDEILLNLMIEDGEGIENLEAIASVDGVDVVSLGPQDLAESMGVREPNDPRLRQAVEDVATRLKTLGRAPMGFFVGHPLLPLSVSVLARFGVVYSMVLPRMERQLLLKLRSLIGELR